MKLLRIAPLAALTVAMIGCTPAAVPPVDNPNNEQDNPNMPYEGDQDPEAFFDGEWNVVVMSTTAETTDGRPCGSATAVLTADNGSLTGTSTDDQGGTLNVTGTVGADGVSSGDLQDMTGVKVGTFTGTMQETTGEGTWEDIAGCKGTYAMIKA